MTSAVIVSATRTAIGAFQGSLAGLTAPQLGAVALRDAVARAGIDATRIPQVIMGCVLSAGLGQAPARQATLGAGLPESANVLTVNKVCSSGLVSVMLADQAIRVGDVDCVVAGGMESMSNAPYLLPKARTGYRMGHGELLDSMIHDGLWDPYKNYHMGMAGELCATTHGFDRAAQDAFAAQSYLRAQAAVAAGHFADEITAVPIAQRKGDPIPFVLDEEPGKGDPAKFAGLRPAFSKDGTITAANASSLSDGAAALVLMSEGAALERNCTPLARIVASATASQAPEWFTTAPAAAIAAVCAKAQLRVADIDLFEINEAFACVALHATKACDLDPARVNVSGGAIALGHPIGASGARILVTLVHNLRRLNKRYGLATLCNGGGEATALIVERL